MEKDFWQQAWQEGRTRFHKDRPHKYLEQYCSLLKSGQKIFVPLAGKSLDMLYLRDQGHQVTAVELSPLAVEAFFKEQNFTPEVTSTKCHTCYSVPGLKIYLGDLFELPADVLKDINGLYDRAALIALPPKMRSQYANFIQQSTPKLENILLVSLEYDQSKAEGPPFSVLSSEVKELYGHQFEIEELVREETEDANPRFEGKGIERFWHTAYHLRRR